MSGLTSYEVTVNGIRTSLRLADADAKALGLLKDPEPEPAAAPAPKKRPVRKNVASLPNKARTADDVENK